MAQRFDQRTSRQHSAEWRDVFAATRDLGARFGMLAIDKVEGFDLLVPPSTPWDAEPIADRYVEEAQPIIETIEQLVAQPQPVWQPLLFAGYGTLLGDLQESRGTIQLLEKEFRVAVHAGDQARALRALRLMRGVARAFDWRIGLITEMVVGSHRSRTYELVRNSLQFDFWEDQHLQILRQWLVEPIDYDARWQAAIDSELAMGIAEFDSPVAIAEQAGFNVYPFGLSAHSRLRFLNIMRQQRETVGAGSRSHIRAVKRIDKEMQQHATSDTYTITGIPFANTEIVTALYWPVHVASAAAFARMEAERRWTLTAVAIRQFRLNNHRWPDDLDELAEVGLAPSDWIAIEADAFGYRISDDGSEIMLWTALPDAWSKGGSISAEPPTENELHSATLDAVLLTLSE